ncbi:hypothetical protein Tco_0718976 [Tanacetum coccineum]
MPTEMELTLEQTQQGVSYEVSNIRVNSFTMKMEILLESTSNKLMVEHAEYDESNTYVLERFNTSAGNPVKKILLKLNLSDHRGSDTHGFRSFSNQSWGLWTKQYSSPALLLTVFDQDFLKMVVEVPDSSWLCQSVKVKEISRKMHINAFQEWKSFDTLADHLQEVMVEYLPIMVDTHIKEQVKKQVPEHVRDQVPVYAVEGLILERPSAVRSRDQDDPHDDAHLEGENSNQEQEDDYDFWTDSYASDDDEIPSKQVSQDIMEEVSLTIHGAKLKKMADEMLRQRYPEAPALSLINQDLLYLKKGSSGPEKIVLSLHKFPTIIFNDDDIEERTSRWVNKCVKKFNPYARYGLTLEESS